MLEVQSLGWIDGWFWVELVHTTYTNSAHDTNRQEGMAGLAENTRSGPIIGAVRLGGFCRLKLEMGRCSHGGSRRMWCEMPGMERTSAQPSSIQ